MRLLVRRGGKADLERPLTVSWYIRLLKQEDDLIAVGQRESTKRYVVRGPDMSPPKFPEHHFQISRP